MQSLICLRPTQRSHSTDESGTGIVKSIVSAPTIPPPPQYPSKLRYHAVPSLAWMCILRLANETDFEQLNEALGSSGRLTASDHLSQTIARLLESGVDKLNPRVWGTLAQVYPSTLRKLSRVFPLPLSDPTLLCLQTCLPTSHCAFLTALSLPGCKDITDETIFSLRPLNTLTALDISGTAVGVWGLKTLARTLEKTAKYESAFRGPWGLRVLDLRACRNINDGVWAPLAQFPLLCVLDLRMTNCRRQRHSSFGFTPAVATQHHLFYPTPVREVLVLLSDSQAPPPAETTDTSHTPPPEIFPSHDTFIISIDELHHKQSKNSNSSRDIKPSKPAVNGHDTFVIFTRQKKGKLPAWGHTNGSSEVLALLEREKERKPRNWSGKVYRERDDSDDQGCREPGYSCCNDYSVFSNVIPEDENHFHEDSAGSDASDGYDMDSDSDEEELDRALLDMQDDAMSEIGRTQMNQLLLRSFYSQPPTPFPAGKTPQPQSLGHALQNDLRVFVRTPPSWSLLESVARISAATAADKPPSKVQSEEVAVLAKSSMRALEAQVKIGVFKKRRIEPQMEEKEAVEVREPRRTKNPFLPKSKPLVAATQMVALSGQRKPLESGSVNVASSSTLQPSAVSQPAVKVKAKLLQPISTIAVPTLPDHVKRKYEEMRSLENAREKKRANLKQRDGTSEEKMKKQGTLMESWRKSEGRERVASSSGLRPDKLSTGKMGNGGMMSTGNGDFDWKGWSV